MKNIKLLFLAPLKGALFVFFLPAVTFGIVLWYVARLAMKKIMQLLSRIDLISASSPAR